MSIKIEDHNLPSKNDGFMTKKLIVEKNGLVIKEGAIINNPHQSRLNQRQDSFLTQGLTCLTNNSTQINYQRKVR